MFDERKLRIHVPDGTIGAVALIPRDPLAAAATPLIVINGGPGGSMNAARHYMAALARGRPVIFYDQLGSGSSPTDMPAEHITMHRYVPELRAIATALGIEKFIPLGHSFGACVALDFALAHPRMATAMILSCPLISTARWIVDANRLVDDLPPDARDAIRAHVHGEPPSAAFLAAEAEFNNRHVCRLDPWPDIILTAPRNRAIYRHLWGVSEFTCTGSLADYDRFPDLPAIDLPVQLLCGEYDEATPETVGEAARRLPQGRLRVLQGCSHLAYAEDNAAYLGAIEQFLADLSPDRGMASWNAPGTLFEPA